MRFILKEEVNVTYWAPMPSIERLVEGAAISKRQARTSKEAHDHTPLASDCTPHGISQGLVLSSLHTVRPLLSVALRTLSSNITSVNETTIWVGPICPPIRGTRAPSGHCTAAQACSL